MLIIAGELIYDGASLTAFYAALALNKHSSAVLAVPIGDSRLIKETVNAGVTVVVCPALPWFGSVERNWIKQFDAVIVNTFPMIESALEIRKLCPVLWWIHEPVGIYSIVMMQYPDGLNEKTFQNINICAVSEKAKITFNSIYSKRIKDILLLGIPDNKLKESTDNKHNRRMVFAIIGVVYSMKGQDVFLEAIEKMKSRSEVEFWIIGRMDDNVYCRNIKEKANSISSVRLLGELTREEMDNLLSQIDVVVCASKEETLSIAVVEGMMEGKICIATNSVGIAEYIEDGKNVFIIAHNDVNALAEKMDWIIANKESLVNIRKAQKKHMKGILAWKHLKKN